MNFKNLHMNPIPCHIASTYGHLFYSFKRHNKYVQELSQYRVVHFKKMSEIQDKSIKIMLKQPVFNESKNANMGISIRFFTFAHNFIPNGKMWIKIYFVGL